MKYDAVQQSLEEFVQAQWSETAVQYDNAPFNSDLYSEFSQFTIVFGDADKTTVTDSGCYRVIGAVIFTVCTKPAQGSQRLLELAALAADLFRSKTVLPIAPLVAPGIVLKTPSLFKDLQERSGWVRAELTTPFFYDIVGA